MSQPQVAAPMSSSLHSTLPRVHLVNPLWDASGGSDWRTIDTWRILRGAADVTLWSEYRPAEVFRRDYPIRSIRPVLLRVPRGGTLVFIGTYFRIGHWTRLAAFERVVIVYNTNQPDRLTKNLTRLRRAGHHPEVVYTSHALRRLHGGTGHVLQSPIDVERFRPADDQTAARPFTVGRLSRDIRSKHHEDDPALWRALADAGCRVRLMGASCLAAELSGHPSIELLPAGAEDAAQFLRSLDAFAYRTSETWFEGYGRVVMEAMSAGLPVVVDARGGYIERIRHRVNGLVTNSTAQMVEAVTGLAFDRALALRLGAQARQDAVAFNRDELPRRTVAVLTTGVWPETSVGDSVGNSAVTG